jgi:hypothetical protein
MSYYNKNCPAGNSILLRSELRAWADAQSKLLDNNPVAKTWVIASHSRGGAARAEKKAKLSDKDVL